nr:MAG TPA: hypothetical protein [Caudoviricetes sp.]
MTEVSIEVHAGKASDPTWQNLGTDSRARSPPRSPGSLWLSPYCVGDTELLGTRTHRASGMDGAQS